MQLLFDLSSIEKYYIKEFWAFESSSARKDEQHSGKNKKIKAERMIGSITLTRKPFLICVYRKLEKKTSLKLMKFIN